MVKYVIEDRCVMNTQKYEKIEKICKFTEDLLDIHNLFIINWYSYLSSKGTACMQSLHN